jgi:hypothetical protein
VAGLPDLLRALEDAPGAEEDLCCCLYPQVLSEVSALLSEAHRAGLVVRRYRKWHLTSRGAITTARAPE